MGIGGTGKPPIHAVVVVHAASVEGLETVILWGILAAAVLPQLVVRRNTQLDLPAAFDVPAPGTTRLDLG